MCVPRRWGIMAFVKILKEFLLCVLTDRAKAERMSSIDWTVVDEILNTVLWVNMQSCIKAVVRILIRLLFSVSL